MNTLRRLRILGAAATLGGPAAAQEAPAMLEPVRISGTRTGTSVLDTPASVDVVDGHELRARNLQVNLSEGLAGVPGLQLQNRQNYAQDLQLSIRGFGARSTFGVRGVRLYVDGIPATMPDGQGQTSNIDIGSAGRVEVLRGPFSALYGNSSGGVVQVFTEQGSDPPEATGSAAAGSFGTWRYGAKLRGASAADGLDYVLDFNRFTTEGYRDHSAARKNLGNARLGLRMDDGSRLTLSANHVDLTAQDPLGLTREQFEDDPRSAPVAERFDTRKTVRQTQGGLLYERAFDTRNDLRVMLYYGQRRTTQYQSIPVAVQQSPTQAGGAIDLGRDYGGADLRWTSRQQVAGLPLTLIGGLAYDTMKEQRRGYDNYTGPPAAPTGHGRQGRVAARRDQHGLQPGPVPAGLVAVRRALDAGRGAALQHGALRLGRSLPGAGQRRRQRTRHLSQGLAGGGAALCGQREPEPVRLVRTRLRDAHAQ